MPMATKQAQRKYQRKWLQRRRMDWINKNGPCQHCGSNKNLEIDHIDPEEKEEKVSSIWSWSKERRAKELKKCQVLCSDCHSKKTKNENIERGVLFEKGYKPSSTKLNKEDVVEIKNRINAGESNIEIAKDFDVGRTAISKIRVGRRWTEVKV